MHYKKKILKMNNFFIIIPAIIIATLSISCDKPSENNITVYPTSPLIDKVYQKSYSLQSGNLLYNGFLTTDGKAIYYQSDDSKSLEKSDFDGKNSKILSNRFPSFINVFDDTIFFVEGANSGKIYKVGTDGKGETLVIDSIVKSLVATSDFIYFIDTKDEFVYYSKTDGSKKEILLNKPSSMLQFSNDILYIQPSGEFNGIYKFDTKKILNNELTIDFIEISKTDRNLTSLNFNKENMYFSDNSNNMFVYMSENSKVQSLIKKPVNFPFIVSNNNLYYVNETDESRLYSMSLNTTKTHELIINDRVNEFHICGNSIYYRREGNVEIFRASIEKGQSSKIT